MNDIKKDPKLSIRVSLLSGLPRLLSWLSLPVFIVAIVILWAMQLNTSYESIGITALCNFFFSILASMFTAYLIGKTFIKTGRSGFPILGAGVIIWGLAGFVAGTFGHGNSNLVITIHNLCVWVSALCYLGGAIYLIQTKSTIHQGRYLLLAAAYVIALGIVGLVVMIASRNYLPVFFVQSHGGTVIRLLTLGSTIGILILTGIIFRGFADEFLSKFYYWCSLYFFLTAIGLFGVMLEPVNGCILGWVGRSAQFLGGLYLFFAGFSVIRETGTPVISVDTIIGFRRFRYIFAFIVPVIFIVIRLLFLQNILGASVPFVMAYPAVVIVALYGGMWSGLIAAVISAILVTYFFMEPVYQFTLTNSAELIGTILFIATSAFIIWVIELMHKAQRSVILAETDLKFLAELKISSKKLSETNALLSSTIESMFNGVLVVDRQGKAVRFNKKFLELWNIPESVVASGIEKKLLDFVVNQLNNPKEFIYGVEEVYKNPDKNTHAVIEFKNGKVLERYSYPHLVDGETIGTVWTFLDVTERKRVEEKLRESEHRFRTMANAMPQLAWIANDDGYIVWYNQRWYEYSGTTPEQMEGWDWQSIHDPVQLPMVLERWKSSIATGELFEMTFPLRGADGVFRSFLTRGFPLKDDKGQIVQWFGTNTDISELRRAEEELRKLNRTLKALSDSNQAMMRADNEEDYLNEICRIVVKGCGYAMVWIGYAEQDEAKTVRPMAQAGFEEGYLTTVNITWADTERGRGPTGTAIRTGKVSICRNMLTDPIFTPWRQEAIKRGYASSLVLPLIRDGKAFGAITIYSKEPDPFSGKEVQLLSELADDLSYGIRTLRLHADQERVGAILRRDKETLEKLIQERTEELLEAHSNLEHAKRLADIGTLAATVAHELRNPLAAIGVNAHNIKRKANNPDIDKYVHNIEKKVVESDQIISNLLFYSRLKPPSYKSIDIFNIVEECVTAVEQQKKKEVTVIKNFDSIRGIMIEADPLQTSEVFNNILNNAFDAISPEKGQIKVTAENEDECIKVTIEDRGIGIAQDVLHKIFDPFFTTKAKGTGLGLSVCKQIINMHEGEIEVKSELGRGSSFTVRLPKKERISGH